MLHDFLVLFFRAEIYKYRVLLDPSRMTRRPIEHGTCLSDLFGSIRVSNVKIARFSYRRCARRAWLSDVKCSLDNVAPVWALTCVIGQSLKERGEVGAGGQFNVADDHTSPVGIMHFRSRGFHRYGQILRKLVHDGLHSLKPGRH